MPANGISPLAAARGVYAYNAVYQGVRGWKSFEPWLSRIAAVNKDVIAKCAEDIPTEWGSDWGELEKLVDTIYALFLGQKCRS